MRTTIAASDHYESIANGTPENTRKNITKTVGLYPRRTDATIIIYTDSDSFMIDTSHESWKYIKLPNANRDCSVVADSIVKSITPIRLRGDTQRNEWQSGNAGWWRWRDDVGGGDTNELPNTFHTGISPPQWSNSFLGMTRQRCGPENVSCSLRVEAGEMELY